MTHYIDGFLLPIALGKVDEYKAIATRAGEVWIEHGALAYWECVGDDLNATEMVSFKHSANAQPDETVIFSWIVYSSREERDRITAAVMSDPRLQDIMNEDSPVFDYRRMAYGGFTSLVNFPAK